MQIANINFFPNELNKHILGFVPLENLPITARVCRLWNSYSKEIFNTVPLSRQFNIFDKILLPKKPNNFSHYPVAIRLRLLHKAPTLMPCPQNPLKGPPCPLPDCQFYMKEPSVEDLQRLSLDPQNQFSENERVVIYTESIRLSTPQKRLFYALCSSEIKPDAEGRTLLKVFLAYNPDKSLIYSPQWVKTTLIAKILTY
jgi:hypothetical protein